MELTQTPQGTEIFYDPDPLIIRLKNKWNYNQRRYTFIFFKSNWICSHSRTISL